MLEIINEAGYEPASLRLMIRAWSDIDGRQSATKRNWVSSKSAHSTWLDGRLTLKY